jgi:hypothetical protein
VKQSTNTSWILWVLSKSLRAAAFFSITMVVFADGYSLLRSTPKAATAVSNEVSQVSQALVGKRITIRGTFSLRCKVPACIGLDNHQVIYLNGSWGGATYSEWEGKLVAVTGILRYYHAAPAEPTDRPVARPPDHFYFEETAQVRLVGGNALTESKQRRTVKGLPKYMTDIPQPIPPQIKLPDAPKTAREAKCFASFTTTSSMTDVVWKCGIPDEHQGSGIYIFLYDMADGSVVVIGTADLKKLMYINQITDRGSHSLL